MPRKDTDIEKRAKLIIKYRKMRVRKREKNEDIIKYSLLKDDKKYVMQCISNQRNVGIAYVRDLRDIVGEADAEGGIILTDSKYTWSARHNAPRLNIELIPRTIPTFDIFRHKLVPSGELLSKEEKDAVVEKYHAKPYQFPWMKSKDPISIILGAKSGDIVRFTSESRTAGTSVSYRYVS
ncbi:restriction endonuclease [Candidatus Bathyarchaeota archaeon]|nr:restriction endonuclease [Candidatus Bathyarchaeota archaeon]